MRDRLGLYNFGDGAGAVVCRLRRRRGRGRRHPRLGDGLRRRRQEAGHAGDRRRDARAAPRAAGRASGSSSSRSTSSSQGRFTPHVLTEALTAMLAASGLSARGDRPLRDPGGERRLHDRRAARGGPADAGVARARGQDLREPRDGRRDRLGGGAARARRRLEDRQGEARRPRDAARDRDEQVEVRRDGADVDRAPAPAGDAEARRRGARRRRSLRDVVRRAGRCDSDARRRRAPRPDVYRPERTRRCRRCCCGRRTTARAR